MMNAAPAILPSRTQAWATIALLFLASIVSVIDRTVLNVVVDAVKGDLGMTDVQISVLQGLAFGIFYATMGVWLGFIADRSSRRLLVVVGIGLWSLATIGGGLAQSFGTMFLARLLVGLGEAALAPAAISLIADLFPPGQRGRPIGIYLTGQAVANGLSIWICGGLLAAASHGAFTHWPLLATLAPWRIVFVLCGVGGLFVSAAFLLTREPPRADAREQAPRALVAQIGAVFRHLGRERVRFFGVYLGFACCFLGAYGAAAWQVAMISRKFALSPAAVAGMMGPLSIGFGLLGPLLGGTLVDAVVKRSGNAGLLRLLGILPLFAIPSTLAVFAPTALGAAILSSSQLGVTALVGTATLAYLQAVAPAHMRGIAVSITGLVNTLLGAALGPILVALLTEKLFGDDKLVGWAILTVGAPAYLGAAALYTFTAHLNRRQDAREAELA
jgi:MFS family permease